MYKLELTHNESTHLLDILSMHAEGPPTAEHQGPYPRLLLKVCGAFLAEQTGEVLPFVMVEQHELWVMREVVKSYARVGDEPVGYNLMRKVAQGLLAETAEDVLKSLWTT